MAETTEPDYREAYEKDFETSRTSLPIYQYREGLIEAFNEYQVLVVVGDTGSGKTTQLPQFIHETHPSTRIIITQPRRIAAISSAARVATETNTQLGSLVGYSIRFESVKSNNTKLLFVTDGTLLQMTQNNFEDVADVVILDEAHERSLETDVLFGILKRAVAVRPTLKLIIMSATLNSDKFSDFFGDCPVFTVPGRMYPVDLLYARKTKMASLKSQLITKSVEAVVQIHKTQPPGDILVFLTGQQEIETTCRLIREDCDALGNLSREIEYYPQVKDISLHPIYSALDTPDQKDAFRPARRNTRKVVVATNIAQTSVTIPGIRYVVDSGFVKEKMFDASTGVDALLVVPISKAAATQRAGRSGRTAPGKVFRLYSRDAFEEMAEDTTPEIQRSSLISTVLALKRMGINDILNFEFIDPPDRDLLITAMKQLYYIDALDETGNLTPLGKTISTLPLPPFLSRALLAACETYNCSTELLTLCAILSSEEIMHHPRQDHKRALAEAAHAKFGHGSGDHVSLIRMYNAWIRNGESEEWCRTRFMKGRSLRAVKNVRGQLEDAVRGLGYVPVSCRKTRKKGSEEKERRRRVEEERRRDEREMVYGHDDGYGFEEDELDDFDAHAILKSLCTGFFCNTAKRHAQRSHFYHYLAASGNSTAGTSVQTGNSGALLSLHIQPSSCLAGPSSNATGINDAISANIEWVVYHDVQFVNRANMRIVSRIDFSWVEKGISRVGQCDVRKLVGLPPEVVEVTSDNVKVGKRKRSVDETKEIKDDERVVEAVVDVEAVKMKEQKEREDKAEAARQRYLSRHNKRK